MSKLVRVATVLVVSTAAADTIYVDDDAPSGGDGRSWDTAYRFLEDALTSAFLETEIRVAQGTYRPGEVEASNCCASHGDPECDDPTCETLICASLPLCCEGMWEDVCVLAAQTGCGGLCDPSPDPSATLRMGNGVSVIGGYAGFGAPDPNERDVDLHQSILSGDPSPAPSGSPAATPR